MDGVLIDTEPLHYQVWQQVFAERGLTIDYENYKDCIGSTRKFLYELILKNYGRDFRNDPTLPARFIEIKDQFLYAKGIPQIKGVTETVKALREKGYILAVASSSPLRYINFAMEKLGIISCFDLLFSGEQVENPKPAPDTFLAVSEKLGIAPEECVVIEDSENGSRAARAAGMYCLGFDNPNSGNQDLSAADEIFYPFTELLKRICRL